MKFSEALEASLNGINVISCEGIVYSPDNLNVKRLSHTSFTSNAVTTDKERKSKEWKKIHEGIIE